MSVISDVTSYRKVFQRILAYFMVHNLIFLTYINLRKNFNKERGFNSPRKYREFRFPSLPSKIVSVVGPRLDPEEPGDGNETLLCITVTTFD